MPVRHYFPFAAFEDKKAGVTWAVQLACPSSWQIEARRQREYLCLTGGLADYETGHWSKTVHPGESFDTPTAYATAGSGLSPEQWDIVEHGMAQHKKASAVIRNGTSHF